MNMQLKINLNKSPGLVAGFCLLTGMLLSGCGGGNGPAIQANPQTILFAAAPILNLLGSATVTATASSGLGVSYGSTTPTVCTVNSGTGVVTDLSVGICIIAANQSGNSSYAPAPQVTQSIVVTFNPNQTILFGAAPALSFGGTATASASATSLLPVSYSSTTPAVCSVHSVSGLISDISAGVCTIAADQAGNANYLAAPQVTQSVTVTPPPAPTVPGAPTNVTATLGNPAIPGDLSNVVTVTIGATNSGGSPITGYTVTASPSGLTASGITPSIAVPCAHPCTGQSFSVIASNAVGNSLPSAPTDVLTDFNVLETFLEPQTQPSNSIFTGSFTFNSTTGAVSKLAGSLTESMTGPPMVALSLTNQLSAISDGAGGLLVTTFLLNTTNTFTTNPAFGGTDGWSPGTTGGIGLYYGYISAGNPGVNLGNAYARIYVNIANPTAALTQAQIDKLAYADCAPGGMMGASCMTGTTVAGYGFIGTMSGYPLSQTITKK